MSTESSQVGPGHQGRGDRRAASRSWFPGPACAGGPASQVPGGPPAGRRRPSRVRSRRRPAPPARPVRPPTPRAPSRPAAAPRARGRSGPGRPASPRCRRRSPGQGHDPYRHAGRAEKIELGGSRGDPVGTDHGRGPQAQPGGREGRVGHSTAEAPAARIVRGNIATDVADVDDVELAALGVS